MKLALAPLVLCACAAGEVRLAPAREGVPAPGYAAAAVAADPVIRGHRLLSVGEPELALAAFSEALVRPGFGPAALVGAGTACIQLGRLALAERYLSAAVAVAPDLAVAWNNLGVLRYARADYAGAETAFVRAGILAPDAAVTQNLALARQRRRPAVDFGPLGSPWQVVSQGGGRYLLVERAAPAGGA